MSSGANLYLEAMKEVDSDKRDEAIWAEALTLCKGDEDASRLQIHRTQSQPPSGYDRLCRLIYHR